MNHRHRSHHSVVERRFFSQASYRADPSPMGSTISDYAAKFNVLSSNLGKFREKLLPGVFARALGANQDTKCLSPKFQSRV